jgi:hypothetical protein
VHHGRVDEAKAETDGSYYGSDCDQQILPGGYESAGPAGRRTRVGREGWLPEFRKCQRRHMNCPVNDPGGAWSCVSIQVPRNARAAGLVICTRVGIWWPPYGGICGRGPRDPPLERARNALIARQDLAGHSRPTSARPAERRPVCTCTTARTSIAVRIGTIDPAR